MSLEARLFPTFHFLTERSTCWWQQCKQQSAETEPRVVRIVYIDICKYKRSVLLVQTTTTMSESPPHQLESGEDGKVGGQTGEKEDHEEDPLVIDEAEEKTADAGEAEDGNPEEDNEKEFEPTVDMLMNEFDDEQTIEEEEALGQEDDGNSD